MTRRVLSLWQPWATLCVGFNGAGTTPPLPAKQYETRHFQPRFKLPIEVAIHAAKRWHRLETERVQAWPFADALLRAGYSLRDPSKDYGFSGGREYTAYGLGPKQIPLGAIIGVATIVAVCPTQTALGSVDSLTGEHFRRAQEEFQFGDYSAGRFAWQLANAIELPTPILFRGRQDVLYELPADVDAAITEQLEVDA
jgi:hypothetical protein